MRLYDYGKGDPVVYVKIMGNECIPVGMSTITSIRPTIPEYVTADNMVFASNGAFEKYGPGTHKPKDTCVELFTLWKVIHDCNLEDRITAEHTFFTIKDVVYEYIEECKDKIQRLLRKQELDKLKQDFYPRYQEILRACTEDSRRIWDERRIETVYGYFDEDTLRGEMTEDSINKLENQSEVILTQPLSPTCVRVIRFMLRNTDMLDDETLLRQYLTQHVDPYSDDRMSIDLYSINTDRLQWNKRTSTTSLSLSELGNLLLKHQKYIEKCDEEDKFDLDVLGLFIGKLFIRAEGGGW